MKKYEEILTIIGQARESKKEYEKELDKTIDKYNEALEGLTMREKIDYRKEHLEEREKHLAECAGLGEKIESEKLKIKLLTNNAIIAFYNEKLPVILEVLNRYNGKAYGKVTTRKIYDEVKEKTNCGFYISESYGVRQDIKVYDLERNGMEFTCGCKNSILVDNKVQALSFEDFNLYYINTTYFDDVDQAVEDIRVIRKVAKEKLKELENVLKDLNAYNVNGIEYATLTAKGI